MAINWEGTTSAGIRWQGESEAGESPPVETQGETIIQTSPGSAGEASGDGQFDFWNMVYNIPGSAKGVYEGFLNTISDPEALINGMADLAVDTGNYIGRKAAEVTTGQDLEIMPGREETMVDNVVDYYGDRYGSWDKALNTLENDPVGALVDMPVGPYAAGKLAASPLKLAATGGMARVGGTTMKNAGTMLQYGANYTNRGARKLEKIKNKTGSKIGARLDKLDDVEIPVDAPYAGVLQAADNVSDLGFEGQKRAATMRGIADDWSQQNWEKGRLALSPRDVQDIKLDADAALKPRYRSALGPRIDEMGPKQRARWEVRNRSRKILEKVDPTIGNLNREYGKLAEAQKTATQAAKRNRVSPWDVMAMGGAGIGATVSPAIGAGIAAFDLLRKPGIGGRVALEANSAANMLPAGSVMGYLGTRDIMEDPEDAQQGILWQ